MAKDVGVDQHQGDKIDLSLSFTDQNGQLLTLKQLTDSGKPTILVPVYYHCPRMCGLVLTGVTNLINDLDLFIGRDYQVVNVSFDSTEDSTLALEKFKSYSSKLTNKAADPSAWHFLVGTQPNISALMGQIGFKYLKDGGDFAHTGMIVILTPGGDISQYFLGIEFPSWHVRLALIEASKGSIGSAFDQILLFCFRFDHLQGKYTWAIFRLLQVFGALTILIVGTFFYRLIRKDRRGAALPTPLV